MSKNLDVRLPGSPSFDLKNAALGAGVSILLVGLFGYVPIILFTAITPPGEGANIGGGDLGHPGLPPRCRSRRCGHLVARPTPVEVVGEHQLQR